MHSLTGIHSEKCVIRWYYHYANIIKHSYTNTDGIAYYIHRLYGTAYLLLPGYKPIQPVTVQNIIRLKAQEKAMLSRHSVNLRRTELLPV